MIHTHAHVTRLAPVAYFTRAIAPKAKNKTLTHAANFLKTYLHPSFQDPKLTIVCTSQSCFIRSPHKTAGLQELRGLSQLFSNS
jgi:hypothetical protein